MSARPEDVTQNINELQDGDKIDVPVADITVRAGFNPRKFFSEAAINELAQSIREQGVIQPIVLRLIENSPFEIIAGERRWRASKLAGLTDIPAVVRIVDDKTAHILATIENCVREDIGPGEEAVNARRMIDACNGDKEEACKHLKWSRNTLESRLLLLHADESVIDALNCKKIMLGHAELLSQLPVVTQQGTLAKVIDEGLSVSDLKTRLDVYALDLGTAKFNTDACQSCCHNSTRQASFFEQNIGEGRCADRECFSKKTHEHLSVIKNEAEERFNTVWFDTEKDPESTTILLKNKIGASQFNEGCKTCGHFGVTMSTAPGTEGELTEDVCDNLVCYREKVAEYQSATSAPKSTSDDSKSDGKATGRKSSTKSTTKGAKSTAKKSTAASEQPKRVMEFVHVVHRNAAAAEIKQDAKMVSVIAAMSLLNELSLVRSGGDDDPLKTVGIKRKSGNHSRDALMVDLYGLESNRLNGLIAELSSRIALYQSSFGDNSEYLDGAKQTLKLLGVDLTKHFTVDKSFIEIHTKSGIEGVLRKAGFHTHYESQHGEGAFAKLLKKKHGDIVADITTSGFDFSGYLPDSVKL